MKISSDDSVPEYSYSVDGRVDPQKKLEEENKILRITVMQLKKELERMRTTPLMVCEVTDVLPENKAIIRIPNGSKFLVNVNSESKPMKAGDNVLVDQKNLNVIDIIATDFDVEASKFVILEKPKISWSEIGGLSDEIREIQEVIELPLLKPEIFRKVGIEPPKGVLLYGPPGTGKTILAKAVAASTNSTFIEIVGSELVQKFIGEGAKLVKEVFALARSKAPSIIFIDELDAIAAKRIELGTSGEREVQRTFMQLLAEIDGFENLGNVKIIGCTNRRDILDDAIIRPGRLDRQILIKLPDIIGREEIFKIHTKRMKLKDVDIKELARVTEGSSGADIRAICTEAGYFTIRSNKTCVLMKHFNQAVKKLQSEDSIDNEYATMFG
ncbi:MAG TPA: proteasome-activating nucleotidase [Candidatus Woesearchaeota archaeon]|nr:proteasome-activating nucleotidase [Candidatus Woesearchaeota archaeon]